MRSTLYKKGMKNYLLIITALLIANAFNSKAQVTASFNVSDSNICAGQDVIFTYTGQGASLYHWEFGDGTVIQSTTNPIKTKNFRETGTYFVSLVATDGNSSDTADIFIRVRPKIATGFSIAEPTNNGYYCLGTSLTISQWSNIEGYDSLQWDFGDGTKSKDLYPKHTYATTGDYIISLQVKGFCGEGENTATVSIVDDSRGKPQTGLSMYPNEVCPGQTVNLNVWPGNTPVDSLRLFLGDGNTTQLDEFDYVYQTAGVYDVQAIAYNACGSDTANQQVHVTTNIMRSGSIYISNTETCLGEKVRGSASSQGALKTIIDYGDGSSDTLSDYASFSHAYSSNGTYTVKAIFEYECGTNYTTSKTVTVGTGTDVYNFSINSYRNEYCLGETVQFNPPWLYPGDTLDIDFGDGTTKRFIDTIGEVMHLYTAANNYTVKAVKSNACGFSKQSQAYVKVLDNAKPRLTINADYNREGTPVCQNDTISLAMQAEGYSLVNPTFMFEDGSSLSGERVFKTFNKGEHLVKATAQNQCGTELTGYYTLVVLNHTANPSLSYYFYPKTQCVNQAFFFDVFAQGAKSITWDMGDGTTLTSNPDLPHFMYAYHNPGGYTVNITAANGCGTSKATSEVMVEKGPDLALTHSDLNVKIGDTVRFENTSNDITNQFWVFNLDIEDTSNAKVITRSYPQRGTYFVSLFGINAFGCWDTITKTIRVGMVGINPVSNTDYLCHVYPNPSSDYVNIQLENSSSEAVIKLFDLTGKSLKIKVEHTHPGQYQANVSTLQNGTYILRVVQDGRSYNDRIVVNR